MSALPGTDRNLAFPRRSRHLPAVLVAVVMVGVGVTAAVDIILVQAGRSAAIYPYTAMAHRLRHVYWDGPGVTAVCAAVVLIGALLVLAGLVPGRSRLAPLGAPTPTLVAGARRSALRRMLRGRAALVDGVDRTRVRLRRRSGARVTVDSSLRDRAGLSGLTESALLERLADLDPARAIPVRVRVRPGRPA